MIGGVVLFCSYIFVLLFLPVTVAGYFLLNKLHPKVGQCWLLAASLYFYGYFNVSYLFLLLGSLLVNYLIGLILAKYKVPLFFAAGVIINLLLLGYCKYYDFFVANINSLFGTDLVLKHLLLPEVHPKSWTQLLRCTFLWKKNKKNSVSTV